MIAVKNLTKKYGDFAAVRDVSFTMEKGRVYGFLGPNGAGKSTTMNIVTGYISATSGTVLVQGQDIVAQAAAAKRCIGYLPEQPPLYPDMTVEEYLRFVAELKGVRPKTARCEAVQTVCDRVGLQGTGRRLIGNLS